MRPSKSISIHALCEEGDDAAKVGEAVGQLFLSTPSARRATSDPMGVLTEVLAFLSTPSARRATKEQAARDLINSISIHALCEEGDA